MARTEASSRGGPARSVWNGSIAFGTVVVPIKVHSATVDKTVRFNEVHASDGARIQHKRICSREHIEVPYREVARGFEVAPDEYVILTKQELDAAAGRRTRSIDIEHFVDAAAIDPMFYENAYYLGVRDAAEAYRLLHEALRRTGRAGIGRWVFHKREYLVAVRPLDSVLALHTMRFQDELLSVDELHIQRPSREPIDREVEMAYTLVETLHARFEPQRFGDTYRERVLDYLDAKRRGEAAQPEPTETPEPPEDLLAALEASIQAVAR